MIKIMKQSLNVPKPLPQVFHGKFVIKDPAVCPHCGLSESGISRIVEFFGLRNMRDGTVRVQSWCKSCRSPEKRQIRSWKHRAMLR